MCFLQCADNVVVERCLRICVSLYVSLCMCLSVCVSLYVSVCMCLSVCVSLYVSVCMCLSVCVSLYVSLCMCLSVCASVCVSLYVSVCMCLSVCVCVWLTNVAGNGRSNGRPQRVSTSNPLQHTITFNIRQPQSNARALTSVTMLRLPCELLTHWNIVLPTCPVKQRPVSSLTWTLSCWLLSTHADRQGGYVSYCLFLLCGVCMVMNVPTNDKASGIIFCTAVHRRPGKRISHFGIFAPPEAQNPPANRPARSLNYKQNWKKPSLACRPRLTEVRATFYL